MPTAACRPVDTMQAREGRGLKKNNGLTSAIFGTCLANPYYNRRAKTITPEQYLASVVVAKTFVLPEGEASRHS
jgi:hypothetical protein